MNLAYCENTNEEELWGFANRFLGGSVSNSKHDAAKSERRPAGYQAMIKHIFVGVSHEGRARKLLKLLICYQVTRNYPFSAISRKAVFPLENGKEGKSADTLTGRSQETAPLPDGLRTRAG